MFNVKGQKAKQSHSVKYVSAAKAL